MAGNDVKAEIVILSRDTTPPPQNPASPNSPIIPTPAEGGKGGAPPGTFNVTSALGGSGDDGKGKSDSWNTTITPGEPDFGDPNGPGGPPIQIPNPPVPDPGNTPLIPNAAMSTGAALSVLTAALAVATMAVDTFVETVTALDDSFQEMVKRGRKFNAPIGMEAAISDAKLLMMEIERANVLSRELSAFARERTQLSVEIKAMNTALTKAILPLFNQGVKDLKDLVKIGRYIAENYGFVIGKQVENAMRAALIASGVDIATQNSVLSVLRTIARKIPDKKTGLENMQQGIENFLNPNFQNMQLTGTIPAVSAKKF